MGFSKEFFFPPIKVFPKGSWVFPTKGFSPKGVFPKGSADRRPRKGHQPRQVQEKAKGFPETGFFPELDVETISDSTNNERRTKGAEAANHKEQVFPNEKWVFPKGFPNRSMGFF